MPCLRVVGTAEAQRGEVGDRPRAHGEHVAQDAADAGRRTLVRLDEARVVVALDLEDGGQAVADVDDAGILARALNHPRTLGGQRSEEHTSELQSLMRISYAVFCLKKKKITHICYVLN